MAPKPGQWKEDVQAEVFVPPPGYSDLADHEANFFNSVRTRKPVVEDTVFGMRAAGGALLSNLSYFEKRIVQWDPKAMSLVS